MPDFDLATALAEVKRSTHIPAPPDDEFVLHVDTQGITLNDRPIQAEQLTRKLQEIREKDATQKRTFILTLQA